MPIPAWLTPTHAVTSRAARLRTCPKCRRPVLVGLDAERAGMRVVADPTPITALGEAIALLSKRPTFDLIGAGKKELNYRDSFAISGDRRYPVIAQHRCGELLDAFTETIPDKARYVIPDVCPF
jgi:hypothetical protein